MPCAGVILAHAFSGKFGSCDLHLHHLGELIGLSCQLRSQGLSYQALPLFGGLRALPASERYVTVPDVTYVPFARFTR